MTTTNTTNTTETTFTSYTTANIRKETATMTKEEIITRINAIEDIARKHHAISAINCTNIERVTIWEDGRIFAYYKSGIQKHFTETPDADEIRLGYKPTPKTIKTFISKFDGIDELVRHRNAQDMLARILATPEDTTTEDTTTEEGKETPEMTTTNTTNTTNTTKEGEPTTMKNATNTLYLHPTYIDQEHDIAYPLWEMRDLYKTDYLPTAEEDAGGVFSFTDWLADLCTNGEFAKAMTYAEAQDELIRIRKFTDTPKETVEALVESIGYERAFDIVATLTMLKAWDGRISPINKEWGRENATLTEQEARDAYFYVNDGSLHTCHLDSLASAMRRFVPTDPTPTEEVEVEASAPATETAPAPEDERLLSDEFIGKTLQEWLDLNDSLGFPMTCVCHFKSGREIGVWSSALEEQAKASRIEGIAEQNDGAHIILDLEDPSPLPYLVKKVDIANDIVATMTAPTLEDAHAIADKFLTFCDSVKVPARVEIFDTIAGVTIYSANSWVDLPEDPSATEELPAIKTDEEIAEEEDFEVLVDGEHEEWFVSRDEAIECAEALAREGDSVHTFAGKMFEVYSESDDCVIYRVEVSASYIINGDDRHPYERDELGDALLDMLEGDTDAYDDMLDECYPPYEVAGLTYYPAHILKECDPIAYRCGLSDWADSLASDLLYEVDKFDESDLPAQGDDGIEVADEWGIAITAIRAIEAEVIAPKPPYLLTAFGDGFEKAVGDAYETIDDATDEARDLINQNPRYHKVEVLDRRTKKVVATCSLRYEFEVNDGEVVDFDDLHDEVADAIISDDFDAFLDEMAEGVEVCGISFCPSRVLSELDPVAYSCQFDDWADAEAGRVCDEVQARLVTRAKEGRSLEDGETILTDIVCIVVRRAVDVYEAE